jgi:hypothetical protein
MPHNMKYLSLRYSLVLVLIHVVLFGNSATAQGSDGSKNTYFSGRDVAVEGALSKADVVLIGKLSGAGNEVDSPPFAPVAGPTFSGARISVIQVLKGTAGSSVGVSFFVNSANHEKSPDAASSYIFFLAKNAANATDQYTILKILPASDDNVSKIKALIAALPGGK